MNKKCMAAMLLVLVIQDTCIEAGKVKRKYPMTHSELLVMQKHNELLGVRNTQLKNEILWLQNERISLKEKVLMFVKIKQLEHQLQTAFRKNAGYSKESEKNIQSIMPVYVKDKEEPLESDLSIFFVNDVDDAIDFEVIDSYSCNQESLNKCDVERRENVVLAGF